jgi:tetratricopeptide (TPR) repeat protein
LILPEKGHTYLRPVLTVLLVLAAGIFLFIFCSREVYESDTFLHLKTGQLIIEGHRIPRTDPFSEANAGKPWVNHESLSQVVFYLLYRLGGPAGLVLYCALAVFVAFGFALFAGADLRYPVSLFGLLLLAIVTASERFQVRPEVHSLAMAGVFLFALERYRTGSGETWVWLLIPLQVLWENLHGGTLLGIELVGAYLVGEGVARFGFRFLGWPAEVMSWKKYKKLAILFPLVILASLVNPWGPMTLLLNLKLQTHAYAMSTIMEWQRTYSLYGQFYPLPIRVYPWLLGITGLSFLLNYKRLNLSQLFVYLGFAALSLLARRNLALFALAAVPLAARNLSVFWESRGAPFLENKAKTRQRLLRLRNPAWVAAAIALLSVCGFLMREVTTDRYYIKNRYFFRFGYGLSSTIYPWGLFEFMDKIDLDGPAFNNHDLGGYFIWREFPRYQVFLDCRSLIYDPAYLEEYEDALKSASGFRILVAKHRLNFAAILHLAGDAEGAVRILYQDPEWVPVYLDQATVLFVRDIPGNQDLIARYGINLAEGQVPTFSVPYPGAFDYASVASFFRAIDLFERAEQYFTEAAAAAPDHPVLQDNLAKTKILLGKYSEAVPIVKRAIELDPDLAEAHMTLANIYYYLQRYEESVREYDSVISISRKSVDAYSNRGAALLNLGREPEALRSFEDALKIDPEHLSARFNRALTLEKMNDPRARSAWEEYLFHLRKTGASPQAIQEAEAHLSGISGE